MRTARVLDDETSMRISQFMVTAVQVTSARASLPALGLRVVQNTHVQYYSDIYSTLMESQSSQVTIQDVVPVPRTPV